MGRRGMFRGVKHAPQKSNGTTSDEKSPTTWPDVAAASSAKETNGAPEATKKPAVPPKPRTFIRHIDRKLTDHDKAVRGAEHRSVLRKIDDTKATAREAASDYRSQLTALAKRELEMRNAIDTGIERVPVDCVYRRNEQLHVIETVRVDKGAVLETRPMTADERQLKIPGTGATDSEVREPEEPKKKTARRRKGPIEATA